MIVDGATGPFGQVGGVPDVVPVPMGEEKRVGFDFFLFQKIEKALRSIDGQEVASQVDEVGVGGGEAAGEDDGFRHGVRRKQLWIRYRLRLRWGKSREFVDAGRVGDWEGRS